MMPPNVSNKMPNKGFSGLFGSIEKYLEKEMANKDREKDEMGFQITRRGQGDRFLSKDVC